MHYICEIILPPTENVEESIKTILEPFSEHNEDAHHSFWDWWVIGGRYAGEKFLSSLDKARLDAFYQWCEDEKVTVSGLTCGKQEISPSSQIPKVDAKWNELFPENNGRACPLFSHSNNQYDSKDTIEDICTVGSLPKAFSAERLIIAAPSYETETKERTGEPEAVFMISQDFWNGVTHVKSNWNGNVLKGLKMAEKKFKNYADSYRKICTPQKDWLSVTVDYHS